MLFVEAMFQMRVSIEHENKCCMRVDSWWALASESLYENFPNCHGVFKRLFSSFLCNLRVSHHRVSCIKFKNFRRRFSILKWNTYSLAICWRTLAKFWLVFVVLLPKSSTNYGKVQSGPRTLRSILSVVTLVKGWDSVWVGIWDDVRG